MLINLQKGGQLIKLFELRRQSHSLILQYGLRKGFHWLGDQLDSQSGELCQTTLLVTKWLEDSFLPQIDFVYSQKVKNNMVPHVLLWPCFTSVLCQVHFNTCFVSDGWLKQEWALWFSSSHVGWWKDSSLSNAILPKDLDELNHQYFNVVGNSGEMFHLLLHLKRKMDGTSHQCPDHTWPDHSFGFQRFNWCWYGCKGMFRSLTNILYF